MGDHGHGRGRGKQKGGGRGARSNSKPGIGSLADSEGFWAHCSVKSVSLGKAGGGRGNTSSQKVVHKPESMEAETEIGERKFAAACKEIQQSVERYMASHHFEDSEDDDDDDEDDLEENNILERVYGQYGTEKDQSRTQQYLQEAFKTGALVCLICIENIKRSDSIWSCGECYSSFHVSCVQKWAKDSIYQMAEAQADTNEKIDKSCLKWCCPKCRNEYTQSVIPTKYLCFCGQKVDPQFDPWLIPHSCGETCRKKLQPLCGHTCLLLCHPGPCPPCPKTVTNTCHCGQRPPQTRRCSSKTWSCGQPCEKILSCGQHSCQDACHPGECKPCPRQSRQPCCCGNSIQLRECANPVWQCDKVCNKQHSCGHHLCQKVCHSGDCGKCPESGVRTCPCGKTSHTLPCTRDIPTCGDTCGKELACGVHFCAERCHKGPCPICLQFRVKQCRCGTRKKEMACSKELTCEIKCKKLRDCRRHTCSRKCCVGDCPNCEQPCGRTLVCRSHKCESRCHQGPCYPCTVTHTISCACGASKITVPCGRERTTKPPKCSKQCKLPSICHHPQQLKHKCHQGPCPTCRIVCGMKLQCGHICPVPCHDAVPVKIVDTKKRAGPWEPVVAPHIEIQKKPCPSCQVPVPTRCFGQHENPNWPCSDLRPYSCGRKCGRVLDCTNHTCKRECHEVENAPDDKRAGSNCAPCEVPCSKRRPEGCNHECGKACHPGDCASCEKLLKIKCHCGLNQLYLKCHIWNTAPQKKQEMQSCKNQCNKLMSCNHRCTKDCHSGPCSKPEDCHKRVAVRCPCKRQRKDFLCHLVLAGKVTLECDNVCVAKMEEKKKAQEEEERRKAEEEQARLKKELEEYERKVEGKKSRRRNRRQQDIEVEQTFWEKYGKIVLASSIPVVTVAVYLLYDM
nr:NF-X1-type zinc finger protein NFXL1-like [Procambarus clarkii]